MSDKLVTAKAFSTLWEASVAVSRLESEGIPAFLKDGHTVNMNWLFSNALGGVKVQVAEQHVDQARDILTQRIENETNDWSGPEASIHCPRCQNDQIEYEITGKKWSYLSWLLFRIPLYWPRKRLSCSKCGYSWKETEK